MAEPRLLVIDPTPMDGPAATSALKASLIGSWRQEALASLYIGGDQPVFDARDGAARRLKVGAFEAAKLIVKHFQPEIILYRPTDESERLDELADQILDAADAGLALWFMDDWLARLQAKTPSKGEAAAERIARLIQRSAANFAISEAMAEEMARRFGGDFSIARNGVDADDWPLQRTPNNGGFLLRYAGSLAPDTTLESVLKAARAVSDRRRSGEDIRLEIRTHRHWLERFSERFSDMPGVSMNAADLTPNAYRAWLQSADALLLAYNFDDATQRYLRYSFANKLPECLASGAPVLCLGPSEIETLKYLNTHKLGIVAETEEQFDAGLARLLGDRDLRRRIGVAGREHALARFNRKDAAARFRTSLADAATRDELDVEIAEDAEASFDECAFVFHAIDAHNRDGVMVDVGAHEGATSLPFAAAGWRIVAFEPDEDNRLVLERRHQDYPNTVIRSEAVGAAKQTGVPFYKSGASSGISGLTAFDPSHRPAGAVDVTTLDAALLEERLSHVDFLKIDVEGREIDVLDGFDLETIKPFAVVAEFDGRKGVGASQLAARFSSAGYNVFLSEWRPIEAYGAAHKWRRLTRSAADVAPDAWGNIIAIASAPSDEVLASAFAAAFSNGPAPASATVAAEAVAGPRPEKTLYRKLSRLIWTAAPGLSQRVSKVRARLRR